jgi:hypothetical protein
MRDIWTSNTTPRTFLLAALLSLSALLGLSAPASAALVEYSGANTVVGSDGVSRNVSVWMIFDDAFKKNGGTPPPVPGSLREGSFGHFAILSYTVNVPGVGVFVGSNGRLNIWYKRTPAAFTYYTEELEVLEDHSLMKFYDGVGSPWGWSPWLASPAQFVLPPELMIPRLNISPGYSFDLGNEIHLFPVCSCKGRPCVAPKT